MNRGVAFWVACLALAAVGARPAAAQQFPTTPPAPAPMAPEHFPPFHEATLSNGLNLVLVENHALPIVSIVLTMPTGEVNDPPTEAGLARLTAGRRLLPLSVHSFTPVLDGVRRSPRH